MNSAKFGGGVPGTQLSCNPAGGCLSLCGMCPSCAFAPKPPGSTRCQWKVSDEFKRRFVVELLLRCRDNQVLENIQSVLGVASWTVSTYARSRSPTFRHDFPSRGSDRALDGKPLGVDMSEIWEWFSCSPDWIKSRYLCRLLSLCDSELLRMVGNLTSVLLVRNKRGFLQFNVSCRNTNQQNQDNDGDSEDPALMVVPGSSKSVSGVSLYRDFICCLPVHLSKRILGLLDEHTLRRCRKVCRYWEHRAQETMEEIKFRRVFQDQIEAMMQRCRSINTVSPTYANVVEVPVPVEEDERVNIHPRVQKMEPFEAAFAKLKTKTVQMEERNVYCGAYFTKMLLDKEDPHRVMDYRGGSFMATGSTDRMVRLLYVASETKAVSVMKGHVGRIRAVLLCEDRHLVITASSDASIRCWDLKTDRCVMMLYGHTGTVNCLDVFADRLVSGAKDCHVKVWSLHTGKHFEDFHFKHPSPVQCVKISTRTVYSSCDRGLVKIWDMENASLLRVIDAHRSSVKCLFFDEWHLLTSDSSGQVMAWSVICDTKCLMTFHHPKEVKSLTLVFLRVVTGCADGKIRIFNFLTGDCLRDIAAEAETGRILSLHFHDNSILVNTTSCVKRFQFARVFWDYTEGGQGDIAGKSAALLGKLPLISAGFSDKQKVHDNKKPERGEPLHSASFLSASAKSRAHARGCCAKQSVILSEKAASERMRRRGLHHPLTRDSILLRVNSIQRAQCTDEVSINMECNARLQDFWGPDASQHTDVQREVQPRRPKTCVPILKRAASQNSPNVIQGRAQPRSADSCRTVKGASGFVERTEAPEGGLARSLPNPGGSTRAGTSFPRISPVGPLREPGGFRLLTVTQLEDQAKRELTQSYEQKLTKRDKRQKKL